MDAWNWKDVAAVGGMALGVINLIRSWCGDRPVFYMEAEGDRFFLSMINNGRRPLLIRRLWVMPGKIWPHSDALAFEQDIWTPKWLFKNSRPWTKLIEPGGRHCHPLNGLQRIGWCFIVIRWTQGNQWPWSVIWVTRGQLTALYASTNPEADLALRIGK
jgi:hypothetical protein